MNTSTEPRSLDCAVIGGGPAGLTAAIYLARYHLAVTVFDDGSGRAATIPITHNHAGFPGGISGSDLMLRMRTQACSYGAQIRQGRVDALTHEKGEFVVSFGAKTLEARTVLIATGVTNRAPEMPKAMHDEALRRGLLRYCPVCDGFEITDKRVAVVGQGERAFHEAVFLRSYTPHITLLCPKGVDLNSTQRNRLAQVGIRIEIGPLQFELEQEAIVVRNLTSRSRFDTVYPALGTTVRSDLAQMLGATLLAEGCVRVDDHQRTDVRGLYAAGDVVKGLDQISHAMGQAGVAATTIRNDLCDQSPLVRRS
ncbi:NAD(P)/FAD-dependent oxidoreductase [Rhizobium sp. NFR07]|uniref:NAD(P)/FAD-dependent oxidoreductase n=1 Tax=Rhizobium sp. NFR07 TaxID=1566262 RepID=UPI0015A5AC10|nr:NAD(P)/FAD-dependent oxidoreductase [Rhizobium sp. NFR07]